MNAIVDPLKTQNVQTVHVDNQGRVATCTAQWLLEKSVSHPPREGNTIQTHICAKDSFAALATDMENAKGSIELVCLGFDPGMAFVRNQSSPDYPWGQGEPIGELLRRKAGQGVKVRLLVWYHGSGSVVASNLVGYVQTDYLMVPGPILGVGGVIRQTWDERYPHGMTHGRSGRAVEKPLDAKRLDYCTRWWRDAIGGFIDNLEVRFRDGEASKVHASVDAEADQPSNAGGMVGGWFDEATLVRDYAVHHQKPILIDYDYQAGSKATGYVMGLNSLTDYWDHHDHAFHSTAREADGSGPADWAKAEAKGYWIDPVLRAAHKANESISMRPLQDYAARIQGPALLGLHLNFARAWNQAQELPQMNDPGRKPRRGFTKAVTVNTTAPANLSKPTKGTGGYAARLQVLRTQPQERYTDAEQTWAYDKSIKHAYFQASSFARSYIYIENQYFFYEEWARHLKANRSAFMQWVQDAGKSSKDARLLHLMVVIPLPENKGMVPRTYDTARSLGHAQAFAADGRGQGQHQYIDNAQKEYDKQVAAASMPATYGGEASYPSSPSDIVKSATKVKTPTLDQQGVLLQDGKSLGMKVLVCKMATPNTTGNAKLGAARDIYIHSKLMLIDDNFMTLGSANLSQRSMAADSELNIATDCIAHNRGLRKRVWGLQTGGQFDGGQGDSKAIETTFKDWEKLAAYNKNYIRKNAPLSITGFLVQFEDTRVSTDRVG